MARRMRRSSGANKQTNLKHFWNVRPQSKQMSVTTKQKPKTLVFVVFGEHAPTDSTIKGGGSHRITDSRDPRAELLDMIYKD